MKKIIAFTFLLCLGKAYAQRSYDYSSSSRPDNYNNYSNNNRARSTKIAGNDDGDYNDISIIDSTQEIRAQVLAYKTDPKIKNDRYYFWYLKNIIHSTQGGYNGQLLNGHYVAFYPDKNLKEQGNFKTGLKDGEWKTWNPKGDLTGITEWNEGILLPDGQQPFWRKVPFLKKKDNQVPADKPTNEN
jgi:antitoxin component YwqK of YwqJK toxin-antitoxin module